MCADLRRTSPSGGIRVRQHGVRARPGGRRRDGRVHLRSPRRFDVVIGADGAHSGVRELTFGPESDYVTHLGVYVATLPLDGETGTDLVMYNTPGRAVAIHPARRRPIAAFMFVHPRSRTSTTGTSTSTSGCYAARTPARAGACPSSW